METDSNTNSESKGVLVLEPIDWGFALAVILWKKLLWILPIPIMLEISIAYYQSNFPISAERIFILGICELALNVFILSAVVLFVFNFIREKKGNFFLVTKQALKHLPKVLFSYLIASLVVLIGIFSVQSALSEGGLMTPLFLLISLPLVMLGVFLAWAPLFCVGEIQATDSSPTDLENETPFEAADRRKTEQFSNKYIWELGFSRAVNFGIANAKLTYLLILFFAFANFVPAALFDFVLSSEFGFLVVITKIIASSVVNIFVIVMAAGAFYVVLPKSAKSELKLPEYTDPREFSAKNEITKVRFSGRVIPYLFIGMCCIVSFSQLINSAIELQAIPETVVVEVEEIVSENGILTIDATLIDNKKYFRWFVGDNFRVYFGKDASDKDIYVSPLGVTSISNNGEPSGDKHFTPSKKPIRVKISFKIPEEAKEVNRFTLYYTSNNELSGALYEGRIK